MELSAPVLLALLLGLLALGAGAFVLAGPSGGQASKRAREIAAGGGGVGARKSGGRGEDPHLAKRRQANIDAVKELGERQRESRRTRLSIKGRLKQAGLPQQESVFWIGSAIAGAVFAGSLFVMGAPLAATLAGLVAGFIGAPRWLLGFLISRRQKVFLDQFADGIDIIVRGVKSGLPLQQCLQIIANESHDPLRSEFQAVVDGQAMGVPLHQNLNRLYERMPLPEINFFAIVLVIQQKTGGNLAEALGNLSGVLRSRKLLKEKIKALSSEAKASAMIIGALPIIVMLLVYFARPDYIMVLFTTDIGQTVLLGAATMMGAGIFVMNRMVNFKY